MATETWAGRTGRRYERDPGEESRSGGMASIVRVRAIGRAKGSSTVPEGTILALKLAGSDPLARETMEREVETFQALQEARPAPPCPRLFDVIETGGAALGLVMEWCPTDMEQWWDRILVLPDAMEPLCGALADICRRIAEYHSFMASRGIRAVHADIKPRNAVLSDDGRWLLTDFGAAKSRPLEQETWEATRLILGTENFIAPEMLFNARKRYPEAMDTWSVAVTFFTLLRMRRHRLYGNELPIDGTHNAIFRCRRMSTVIDLRERSPALFVDADLQPAEFHSPDRLPEGDRRAVSEALLGVFGTPDEAREHQLEASILALLDRALSIDPALRFTRASELSDAFDSVVRRYWELEGSMEPAQGPPDTTTVGTPLPQPASAPSPPPDPEPQLTPAPEPAEAAPMPPGPDHDEGRPTVVGPGTFESLTSPEERTVTASDALREGSAPPIEPDESAPDPPEQEAAALAPAPQPAPLAPPPGPSAPAAEATAATSTLVPPDFSGSMPDSTAPPSVPSGSVPDPTLLAALEDIRAQLARERGPTKPVKAKLPFWMVVAIGLLIFCQAVQFGLLVAIFLQGGGVLAGGGLLDAAPTTTLVEPGEPSPFEAAADGLAALDAPAEASAEGGEDELDVEPEALGVPEEPDQGAAGSEQPDPIPDPTADGPAPAAPPIQAAPPAPAPQPAAAEPQPRATSSSSARRSSSPPPAAEVQAGPEAPAGAKGQIRIDGASGYVVGPSGQRPLGELPAGTYEVFAEPTDGAGHLSLGVHSLVADGQIVFRCGFGSCREVQ